MVESLLAYKALGSIPSATRTELGCGRVPVMPALTCEVKAGGSEKLVQDHPQESEASLVYIRSILTNKQQHNAPLFIDYSLHAEL